MSFLFGKKDDKPLVDILGEATRKYRDSRDTLVQTHIENLYQKTVEDMIAFTTRSRDAKFTLDFSGYKLRVTPNFDDSEIRAIALGVAEKFREQNIGADHKFDGNGWICVELTWPVL